MTYGRILRIALVIQSACFTSCSDHPSKDDMLSVESMKSPSGVRSSEPNLHVGSDEKVYLSWVETSEDHTTTLYYSTINHEVWSQKNEISQGDNWFVNWADFPSMSAFGQGSIASHFLVESGEDTYAYDVNVSISNDQGKSWSTPMTPHTDSTLTEHGFVSMVPYKDEVLAVWLDGRNYALIQESDTVPSNEMTLRSAVIDKNGQLSEELLIDNRVCSCCQTDAALVATGPILVYRDRTEAEIRDISVVRLRNGKWTEPQSVFNDNWEINGCPVNGPAIDVKGDVAAVAWYTQANGVPKIKVAFSKNDGESFDHAVVISDSNPAGRVDLIVLDDGSALISWLETGVVQTSIKACRVNYDGTFETPFIVSQSSESRSSGFPKMVMKNDTVYFAWTEVGESLSVKTAYKIMTPTFGLIKKPMLENMIPFTTFYNRFDNLITG